MTIITKGQVPYTIVRGRRMASHKEPDDMSLVQRLRDYNRTWSGSLLTDEAAARIETMERALRSILGDAEFGALRDSLFSEIAGKARDALTVLAKVEAS